MTALISDRITDLMLGYTTKPAVALESTINEPQCINTTSQQPMPSSVDITQQGSIYHVMFDIRRFYTYSDQGRAFLLWLYAREDSDTIILTVADAENMNSVAGWMMDNTTLFHALAECKATIIGLINSVVMGQDAYVYMTCDKLSFGPYAMLLIPSLWTGSANNRSADQMVSLHFVNYLYEKAVRLQLLTQEEVALLCDGQTVTLSPQHYADASFEHLTFYQEKSRELAV